MSNKVTDVMNARKAGTDRNARTDKDTTTSTGKKETKNSALAAWVKGKK